MLIGFIILEMDPVLVETIGETNMFLNSSACFYQRGGLSKKLEKQLSMVSLVCLFGGKVLKRPLDYINDALLLYYWRKNFHG